MGYLAQQQRQTNIELLIQYVNSFAGCKATPHASDKLLWVESMHGHLETIPATLSDVEDWLRA